MEIIGKQIEFGVAVENVRGTAETVASKWNKNVTADILPRVDKVIDDNSQGIMEDSINSRVVRKWYDGDLTGIAHADAIGYFFYQLYGSETPATLTAGAYSHTFELLQAIEHPTLSAFVKDGGVYQGVLDNGVVNTLEINATTDDFVRFTTNVIFSDGVANADTPTYDTEYDFIGKDISVKVADTEAGLVGATPLCLKDLTITWDTGAITDYCFGSYNPTDIYNGKMSIEGSFTLNYTDDTFKDLMNSDDSKYMEIAITGEAVLPGSNSPEIKITLNKVQVQEWSRSGGNDDIVSQEVSFKGFYKEADGEQSKVEITNATTQYQIGS